jgi:hypothetical protein
MCAMQEGNNSYTESTIMLATRGRFSGEYVVTCAKNQCGYLGMLQICSAVMNPNDEHSFH